MADIAINKIYFPKSIWEFILDNSFKDTEEIYTNGALLIPTYRVKQAIEHYYEPKSVTPQPKRGKWEVIRKEYEFMGSIVNEPQGCKCSNCFGIVRLKSDFCPNCGADMRDIRETGITAKEGMEIAKAFHDGIMEGFAEMEQQRRGDA